MIRRIPRLSSRLLLVAFTSLLVDSSLAQNGASPPGPRPESGYESGFALLAGSSRIGPGADFHVDGFYTRIFATTGANPSPALPQTTTVQRTGPALPGGAVVEEHILTWSYLIDGPQPASDTIQVNGSSLTGTLGGFGVPDVCWGKGGVAVYRATLSPGSYALDPGFNSFTDMTDKALGNDPNAYGEGLTIVTVYTVPGQPTRAVDLFGGYASTQSGPQEDIATIDIELSWIHSSGDLHFFLDAIDGQDFGDSLHLNGRNIGTSVPGGQLDNAWIGSGGPGVGLTHSIYDFLDTDLAGFFSTLVNRFTIETRQRANASGQADCIGHMIAAASYELGPVTWPGTGEDLRTRFRPLVGGASLATVGPGNESMGLFPGRSIEIMHDSPSGTFVGTGVATIFGSLVPTGTLLIQPFPGLWLDPNALFLVPHGPVGGHPATIPAGGVRWGFRYFGGLAGASAILQVLVTTPSAANGFYAASDGFEIRFL